MLRLRNRAAARPAWRWSSGILSRMTRLNRTTSCPWRGSSGCIAAADTLRKGNPIVEYVGAGYFTENGHYVVLRGITEDGKLLVADPNSEEKTTQKTYRFAAMIQQGKGDYPFMICEKEDASGETAQKESAQRSAKRK